MKSFVFAALTISLLGLAACSNKDDSGPTNTELLTSATWKYKNAGVDVNNDGFIDTGVPPGYVGDCDKDNLLTFKSDGTGILDEGATKCDPGEPQTKPFTWTFKNNETVINFPSAVFSGITGDVKILKLTSTELNLSKEVNIGGTTTVFIVVELQH